jgi:hypothetical protein
MLSDMEAGVEFSDLTEIYTIELGKFVRIPLLYSKRKNTGTVILRDKRLKSASGG